MTHEQANQIEVDDFMLILDNENVRVIVQFIADMSTSRKPMALVIDKPETHMSIEDDNGVIVKFNKILDNEEFFTLSLAGEVTLAVISPENLKIRNCFNVPVIGKLTILPD